MVQNIPKSAAALVSAAAAGSAMTVFASVLAFNSEKTTALETIKSNSQRIAKLEGINSDMRDNQIRIMMFLRIDPNMPISAEYRNTSDDNLRSSQ